MEIFLQHKTLESHSMETIVLHYNKIIDNQ